MTKEEQSYGFDTDNSISRLSDEEVYEHFKEVITLGDEKDPIFCAAQKITHDALNFRMELDYDFDALDRDLYDALMKKDFKAMKRTIVRYQRYRLMAEKVVVGLELYEKERKERALRAKQKRLERKQLKLQGKK